MKRRDRMAVVAVVAIVAIVAVWLFSRYRTAASRPSMQGSTAEPRLSVPSESARRPADRRIHAPGSIAGTIRDDGKAPIAAARVCADASSAHMSSAVTQEPLCATSDGNGRYELRNLIAADYAVHAAARQFRPAVFQPYPGSGRLAFPLAAGESRTGVDLVLQRGGVEITGVVLDLGGGPIVYAQVRASLQRRSPPWPPVDTDDQGRFSMWVDRGPIWVSASADGYAPNRTWGRAPGNFELLLTPAASLRGTVVDSATHQPIEGARVEVESTTWNSNGSVIDITGADGVFRADRLTPGRFTATAITDHGYGRTDGSLLVGLGQHVDGVVIQLFPAHRVAGAIVIASSHEICHDGRIDLEDRVHDRSVTTRPQPDGQQVADGLLSGTYAVTVRCSGYQSRNRYDPLIVADSDLTGLVWEVDPGAKLRGKVITKSGDPVEGARLSARNVSGAGNDAGWSEDTSKADGAFELAGLKAGTHRVFIEAEQGVAPREGVSVEIAAGATVEHDFVLDDGGKLVGIVIDPTGRPIVDVQILAMLPDEGTIRLGANYVKSDASGGFTFETLRAGDYQVTALRGLGAPLRKPGTTDDAKQHTIVTVHAGRTATVKLVVESQIGTIKGSVVDAAGKPVGDAFVSSSRESDAAGAQGSSAASTRDDWWGAVAPVLTSADGSFAISQLAPGAYTVRAYRKGGGEAIAEHVAVGSVARLQIKPTGSIQGTARREGGPPPSELAVALRESRTGLERDESFYRSGGNYVLRDLPAGHFELAVTGDGSQRVLTVDLQEAEVKTGVDVTLDPLITVTGRLVEYGTQKPVAGMYVFADRARGGAGSVIVDVDRGSLSDETGRFSVPEVPGGQIGIRGVPKGEGGDYPSFYIVRSATGTGTVDVGNIGLLKRRLKLGDQQGDLGLHFAEQPADTPVELTHYQISWIDPAGPAARTDLRIGDVITSCDGIDVSGLNSGRWRALVEAPPGTRLSLGTRRGVTVAVVLAAP